MTIVIGFKNGTIGSWCFFVTKIILFKTFLVENEMMMHEKIKI